jgi:hypothetical protein
MQIFACKMLMHFVLKKAKMAKVSLVTPSAFAKKTPLCGGALCVNLGT